MTRLAFAVAIGLTCAGLLAPGTAFARMEPGARLAQSDPVAPPAQNLPAPQGTGAGRPLGRGRGLRALPPPPNADTMTAQQVEEYFDAAVLFQAQSQLQLSEEQFLRFGARLRRLQMLRRQFQRQRLQAIRDLDGLLGASGSDETAIGAKLKALDAVGDDSQRQLREAHAAVDEVLTVRQRARFRVFEELMERRKLDLLARARAQGRRSGAGAPPAP